MFRYTIRVAGLLHREGGRLRVPSLFPAELVQSYAAIDRRSTTQLLAEPLDLRTDVRLHLAPGLSLNATPTAVHHEEPLGSRFSFTVVRNDGGLRMLRRLRIPAMRVAPGAYPRFAHFCRQVDDAEAQQVELSVAD